MLRSLDAEMDSSFKGIDPAAGDAEKKAAAKAQLPKTFERIDDSLSVANTVKIIDTYGVFFEKVKAGNEITVTPDAISIDDNGVATVRSSAIHVAFDKKARQIDRGGESKISMVYKDGVWKVSDAAIAWDPPLS